MQNIYAVIIGTEILQGRRVDKHFDFLKNELEKKSLELHASFVIKDDKKLLKDIFTLVKNDKNALLFCFGGIGSTPDDLTREISAEVFTCKKLKRHKKALKQIEDEFKDEAYPHRVKMADLPENAKLLKNVVNNVSGYSLEDRLFFMPGFPSMSHPMVKGALSLYVKNGKKLHDFVIRAYTRENDLVDFMENLPLNVELSSLPRHEDNGGRSVEIRLRSSNEETLFTCKDKLLKILKTKNIKYKIQ